MTTSAAILTDKLILADGRAMPFVGMGTWKMTTPEVMEPAVDAAIEVGYRLFDTAESYENEEILGVALKKALEKYGLKREDIWITTKIPPWKMDHENAKESILQSIKALDCGYLDLALIHWPTSIIGEPGEIGRDLTWKGLVEMKQAGFVKSIGVSNFLSRHLE